MVTDKRIAFIIKTQISRYSTPALARAAAKHCTKIQALLHGDDGRIWSTSPASAAVLEKAGYEIIGYAH